MLFVQKKSLPSSAFPLSELKLIRTRPKPLTCLQPCSNKAEFDWYRPNPIIESQKAPASGFIPRCWCTPCYLPLICWLRYKPSIHCIALHDNRLAPSQKAKSTRRKAMDCYCSCSCLQPTLQRQSIRMSACTLEWWHLCVLHAWSLSCDRQTQMAVSIATKSSTRLLFFFVFAQQPTLFWHFKQREKHKEV